MPFAGCWSRDPPSFVRHFHGAIGICSSVDPTGLGQVVPSAKAMVHPWPLTSGPRVKRTEQGPSVKQMTNAVVNRSLSSTSVVLEPIDFALQQNACTCAWFFRIEARRPKNQIKHWKTREQRSRNGRNNVHELSPAACAQKHLSCDA